MTKIRRIVPKKYIRIDPMSHTTSLRDKKTGEMRGRKVVKGRGDLTRVRRVKTGKYRGHIFGRTPPIKVKKHKRVKKKTRKIYYVRKYKRKRI